MLALRRGVSRRIPAALRATGNGCAPKCGAVIFLRLFPRAVGIRVIADGNHHGQKVLESRLLRGEPGDAVGQLAGGTRAIILEKAAVQDLPLAVAFVVEATAG